MEDSNISFTCIIVSVLLVAAMAAIAIAGSI